MKHLNVSITTPGSLKKAIKYLENYKNGFNVKVETLISRLVAIGLKVVDERIKSASGDSDKSYHPTVFINDMGDYVEATLTIEGKDIAFIEFGAGIHFNTAAGSSPRKGERGTRNGVEYQITGGEEIGWVIGSYGKGYGKRDFWFYNDEYGTKQKSFGTQATMPLHEADIAMIDSVEKVFREVFGNG